MQHGRVRHRTYVRTSFDRDAARGRPAYGGEAQGVHPERQAVVAALALDGLDRFGLVNVPVRLFPAVREHTLHFHFVHETDCEPIGYQKICKAEEKPVPDDEIVKAFEYSKGEYVVPVTTRTSRPHRRGQHNRSRSTDFVPVRRDRSHLLREDVLRRARRGAEQVYALFVKALEESELVAIGKFVMRDRQRLAALRVIDGVIALEQLHFADEIRRRGGDPAEGAARGGGGARPGASADRVRSPPSGGRPSTRTPIATSSGRRSRRSASRGRRMRRPRSTRNGRKRRPTCSRRYEPASSSASRAAAPRARRDLQRHLGGRPGSLHGRPFDDGLETAVEDAEAVGEHEERPRER